MQVFFRKYNLVQNILKYSMPHSRAYIVQSFTELQGGEFKVETDGDLFKVTLIWKMQTQMEEADK